VSAHFVGSIVYIEKGLYQVSSQSPLLVIDGQQRLTTMTLLIAALAKALDTQDESHREPVDGFSPRKLRNYYLLNPEEEGERRFKLLLSQTDRSTLTSIVGSIEPPKDHSLRVMQNFLHFEELIAGCKGEFTAVCKGLAKLVVVDIALNRDQDNPQLIFESMNSTGRELSQADLIRNFILMGLEPALQTRLYEQYWRPMEVDFGQEAYGTHFDAFMRHYLTVKTGEIPKLDEVYEAFKEHARSPAVAGAGVEALVKDIRDFGRFFCAMALGAENDPDLSVAFHDLRELKVDVAYPFLLELYDDYKNATLPAKDFVAAVRLIEAYVFRRAICAIPTASLNKTFATFSRALKKDRYEHWIWDDRFYPPRPVQGFYKKAELQMLIQRRGTRKKLANAPINGGIVERYYQTRAIRRVGESFDRDRDRKALLVMATGSGKTRTVVALCDALMRANWAKRILFLADRVALVNQAVGVFKAFLPDASPVNLVTEKQGEGRVFVSTYPTMMGLIEDSAGGQRRFGTGHFDLIIIDEAHRSVFQKYRAIFDYFDSLLVGLTATPKEQVDRNTYSLFELEDGVPTDEYGLERAVKDCFLVPLKAVSVPLKFQREGIKYDDLPDDEKEQWEALDWSEEGGESPKHVEAEAVNKWLFNKDTVDKVLEHLMTRGQKVDGGDKLGKTIIFAKNHDHAEYIAARFNANYPKYAGAFARVIDFEVTYAQSLIDAFANSKKLPQIAISVDMLDTGIDVPEVVNLVFFKIVRSKTKFWQMVGRGTRLCKDLFGPGNDKEYFYIFDYCQNLEFFKTNPEATDGTAGVSLGARLFRARLELIGARASESTGWRTPT
jgi:uncharacterized protein with ParB-like and HNH nuclease domain/superfamily II DNA or RNA helicase